MLRLILLLSLLILFTRLSVTAQTIEGYWLSNDSCRKYEIKKDGNSYYCILSGSSRKADKGKAGALVLRDVTYNKRNNFYSGHIISLEDGTNAITRIYIDKENQRLNFVIYSFLRLISTKISWNAYPQ